MEADSGKNGKKLSGDEIKPFSAYPQPHCLIKTIINYE
jgi:hypothetical protein